MINLFLLFIGNAKNKIILTSFILIAALIVGNIMFFKAYIAAKNDRDRIEQNFENKEQKIKVLQDRNGTLHSMIVGLNLKTDEFKKNNSLLTDEINNMKIKLKRVESASNVVVKYRWKSDTIYQTKLQVIYDTISKQKVKTFNTEINNKWINSSWKSVLSSDGKYLNINDYQVHLNDSLIFVTETMYKGWWIFRKSKGIKLHVKSKNPYSNIERIEYIKITK